MLCNDIIEKVGKQVMWVRDREKWVRFWKNLVCEYINPINYVDTKFDRAILRAIWFHWKLQLLGKYETKFDQWAKLTDIDGFWIDEG